MSYSFMFTDDDGSHIYIRDDQKRTCIGIDEEFQQWLRDNQDNLPDDIQAKIDAGELTIADAE